MALLLPIYRNLNARMPTYEKHTYLDADTLDRSVIITVVPEK